MKLYKSGLALKREGTHETVAAFINEQDLDSVLEAVMTKKKPNKPVPGDEGTERMGMPSAARDAEIPLPGKLKAWRDGAGSAELGPSYSAGDDAFASDVVELIARYKSVLKSIAGPVADIGAAIHYPACWDTAAYPTVRDALTEIAAFKCSKCTPAPVQQAAPSEAFMHCITETIAQRNRAKRFGDMPFTVAELEKMLSEAGVTLADHAGGFTTWSFAAAPAQPVGLSDDIEERTEKIRLAHANPHTRSKAQLIRDVGYLLSHIALQRSVPVGLSEQDRLDAARLDWLNANFFSDQKDEWDERRSPNSIKWKFFGPMNMQGNVRKVIDAAILAAKEAP